MADSVNILLVEDNPSDRALIVRALKKYRLGSVKTVPDGAQALEFLFGARTVGNDQAVPRLILLDLKLPGVDGLEVLRRIRSDPRTRLIPVVIFTAVHDDRDIIDSYQLGVNSYIVKPVNAEQFTALVQQLGLYWMLLNQPP
jgi:two-component system, response regulator